MADSVTDTIILVIAIVAVVAVVAYIEIRYLRAHREARIDSRMMKDETFNAILTTKAVARSLKDRGYSTKEADLLLIEAESAYERGSFLETREKASQARAVLRDLQRPSAELRPTVDLANAPEPEEAEKQPRMVEPPLAEAKRLPKNFLESRFMISTADDAIAAAEREGGPTQAARESLEVAQVSFEKGEYTEALKHALKAKKLAEGEGEERPEAREAVAEEPVLPEILAKPVEEQLAEECAQCGTSVKDPDDSFCRKCGAELPRRSVCPSCGAETAPDDVFCRKCGTRLVP